MALGRPATRPPLGNAAITPPPKLSGSGGLTVGTAAIAAAAYSKPANAGDSLAPLPPGGGAGASAPTDASADSSAVAHTQTLHQTEQQIESTLSANPQDMKSVYQELDQLRKSETDAQFQQDLNDINFKLHQDGWLPQMMIGENSDGSLGEQQQTPDEWQQEQQTMDQQAQAQQQAQASGSDAGAPNYPAPQSPDGYQPNYQPSDSGSPSGSGGPSSGGSYSPSESYNPNMTGSSGPFDYNPTVNPNGGDAIMQAASADVGKQMWTQIDNGESGGNLGCAASVSAVLDQAGVANVSEINVQGLQNALEKQGWTVTTQPQPGDVVLGYGGLSDGHTGIVGQNDTVFDNHSSTGQWSQDSLSYFHNWNQVVFLQPPAKAGAAPAPAAPLHAAG